MLPRINFQPVLLLSLSPFQLLTVPVAYCGCIADYEGKLPEVKKVQVMDGVGMQGWVEVGDDWMHIAVGNERLLKSHGGKVRPSKAMQKEIDAFVARFPGEMVLFVVIEDEIKAIMALAGDLFVHVMAYEVGTKLILIYRRYGVYS